MNDSELLSDYALERDEAAFQQFVERYLDFVYSTALRRLNGDKSGAEEVTQNVFLVAARKARALAAHPAVAGWLYRTATQTADNVRRSEIRRKARELEAAQMNSGDADDSLVEQVLPLLEDAMQELAEPERLLVLSRFFLKKPMRELATSLGISEAAAKMRVSRAVEQLRSSFARRGLICSAAVLTGLLEQKAVHAAPAALLTAIGTGVSTLPASGIMAGLLTRAFLIMSYTKPIKIGVAALLLALLGVGVYEYPRLADRSHSRPAGDRENAPGDPVENVRTARPEAAVRRLAVASTDANAQAIARLRAALAKPLPKSGAAIWPSEEVTQAIEAFADKNAAFATLKAAIAHPEDLFTGNLGVGHPEDLVRTHAIRAMGLIASEVPEVKPFLWELYQTRPDVAQALYAIMELKSIGLTSEDLPKVIEGMGGLNRSPAGRRYVPQAIADIIAADPAASAPAISALQELLSSSDEKLRFSAASALATSKLDDPRVAEALAKPLTNSDNFATRLSVEALAKAGPKAAQFLPALLDVAKSTSDEYLRRDTFRAIAAIQPDATQLDPDVARFVATDASERELGERLENGGASIDDLMAALRLPQYATKAADRIGELGSFGSKALAGLREALEGKDEDARNRILDAIHKVAPDTKIERVDSKTMSDAMISTDVSLGARGNDYQDPVTKLVMERRAFNTWWTRDEVVSFAKRLNALDPTVARVFVSNVTERDPSMTDVLTPVLH